MRCEISKITYYFSYNEGRVGTRCRAVKAKEGHVDQKFVTIMTTDSYTTYLTTTKLCIEGNIVWNWTLGYELIHICDLYVYIRNILTNSSTRLHC